ncbi:hypothetical protein [Microbacterium gorillae]|uniref:hypothetical protein n=1 Tax=Microbacterium gorillae TaxID=1231063 RepID=UPI0006948BFB|nr:hypothetical protein [Microbacterium gorillae]
MTYPTYPSQPPQPGYAQQPGYGYAPPAQLAAPVDPNTPTNTVWIWPAMFLPMLPALGLFFVDWPGLFATMEHFVLTAPKNATPAEVLEQEMVVFQAMGPMVWVSILVYPLMGLSVLFFWLDWRELGRRGIVRRFHWAWAFIGIVASVGALVSVIGRTVVLRQQGLRAMAPLWAYIAAAAVSVIGTVAFSVWLMSQMSELMIRLAT